MDDDDLRDIFAALGPIAIRRMFGGKGVYHDGRIVAVVLDGELKLKGDAVTAPAVEAAGGRRWTYAGRGGGAVAMPYWSVPEAAFDDHDAMAGWVRLAGEAAWRAASAAKPKRKPRRLDTATRPGEVT